MKNTICGSILLLVVVTTPGLAQEPSEAAKPEVQPPAKPFDRTDHYDVRNIEGWRVLVNKSFLQQDPELCRRTLTLLRQQLYQIVRKVPGEAVAKLRQVHVWVEAAEGHHPCMAYHPHPNWLRQHGMNPDKAGCIEVANAGNFLTWTLDQPWMVLHELAHAYHHRFLGGYENPQILQAYKRAVAARSYESVLRLSGKTERAYAARNQMEYFAEASEAYFGTNDFYPFVRAEVKQHDPQLYELLEKLWNVFTHRGGTETGRTNDE